MANQRQIDFYQRYRAGANMSAFARSIGLSQGRVTQIAYKGEVIEGAALGRDIITSTPADIWAEDEVTRNYEYSFALDPYK